MRKEFFRQPFDRLKIQRLCGRLWLLFTLTIELGQRLVSGKNQVRHLGNTPFRVVVDIDASILAQWSMPAQGEVGYSSSI
jgi:hypothetical protein